MLFEPYVRFHSFSSVLVTEWSPIGKQLLTRLTICSISIGAWLYVFFPPRFLELEFHSDCAFS